MLLRMAAEAMVTAVWARVALRQQMALLTAMALILALLWSAILRRRRVSRRRKMRGRIRARLTSLQVAVAHHHCSLNIAVQWVL